jgi:hypothetical protein
MKDKVQKNNFTHFNTSLTETFKFLLGEIRYLLKYKSQRQMRNIIILVEEIAC